MFIRKPNTSAARSNKPSIFDKIRALPIFVKVLLGAPVLGAVAPAGPTAPAPIYRLDDTGRDASSSRGVVLVNGSRSMSDCEHTDDKTALRYAEGRECPPQGFPYTPELRDTDNGLRAMDPYENECSWLIDTGWAHNFDDACATHDYLADLQRFGAPFSESDADHVFFLDMRQNCKERDLLSRTVCRDTAESVRTLVRFGDYTTGDPINVEGGRTCRPEPVSGPQLCL